MIRRDESLIKEKTRTRKGKESQIYMVKRKRTKKESQGRKEEGEEERGKWK